MTRFAHSLKRAAYQTQEHDDWCIPARQMTFIYCSKPMTDLSRTISSFSELEQYTTIHVTRNMVSDSAVAGVLVLLGRTCRLPYGLLHRTRPP